jgi:hypothetical protein
MRETCLLPAVLAILNFSETFRRMLVKRPGICHVALMSKKPLLPLLMLSLAITCPSHGQNPPANPANPQKTEDSPQSNRFWQATLPGGHYMVALDRISAVSRHQYVLDGAVIVDEVTIDSLGQALARFYFIQPITASAAGNSAGAAAGRIVDRASELVDKAGRTAGVDVHQMVVKKFPETTHSKTIEYRLLSAEELGALHNSVRAAWENGRGRKFAVK